MYDGAVVLASSSASCGADGGADRLRRRLLWECFDDTVEMVDSVETVETEAALCSDSVVAVLDAVDLEEMEGGLCWDIVRAASCA